MIKTALQMLMAACRTCRVENNKSHKRMIKASPVANVNVLLD